MKKTIKVFAAIMLITALVFSIASCGAMDPKKVAGDWYVSTINGQTAAEYAASLGTVEANVQKNLNVTDKKCTISNLGDTSGNIASVTGDIEMAQDGFIFTTDNAKLGFVLDEKANTLTCKFNQGGVDYTYVYVKGTYDIAGQWLASQGGAAEGGEEEYAEGGEEEYYDEDYAE